MMTLLKPIVGDNPQGNYPQELKPIIPFQRYESQNLVKGECHMYKLQMIPYNTNSPIYDLVVLYVDVGIIIE
eukprot:4620091-Ditylum_brightwellii.AAC.1